MLSKICSEFNERSKNECMFTVVGCSDYIMSQFSIGYMGCPNEAGGDDHDHRFAAIGQEANCCQATVWRNEEKT